MRKNEERESRKGGRQRDREKRRNKKEGRGGGRRREGRKRRDIWVGERVCERGLIGINQL